MLGSGSGFRGFWGFGDFRVLSILSIRGRSLDIRDLMDILGSIDDAICMINDFTSFIQDSIFGGGSIES